MSDYPIINLFLVLEFLRVMRDGVSMKKSRIFPVYFTSLTSIYIFVKSGQKSDGNGTLGQIIHVTLNFKTKIINTELIACLIAFSSGSNDTDNLDRA